MKVIVTHHSPDLDAITSIWLIKRFLPGWEEAKVKFVPAGERLAISSQKLEVIEKNGGDEVIHVDTGLGPLDHHQTADNNVSAASLTFDFVKEKINGSEKQQAIERIVRVVVDADHFKEALWPEPMADYHEFSLLGIVEGLRNQFPRRERFHVEFIIKCLNAILHHFENRIWAEKEIKKGIKFKLGKEVGIAFETINDTVLPLAQKSGFSIVLRKDPRKGYVRIKVRPDRNFDLTPVYKKLRQLDPQASWFLHISKKMLLNGTTKNPTMRPTKLTLQEIMKVLEKI